MTNGSYPPPPYKSPAPPYQDQQMQPDPRNAGPQGSAPTSSKEKVKPKSLIMMAIFGFVVIFFGALLANISGSFLDAGKTLTDVVNFTAVFLKHLGAFGSAAVLLFGALVIKDSWMKLGMVLGAAILVVTFLV